VDFTSVADGPLDLGLRVACGDGQPYITSIVRGVIDRVTPRVYFSDADTISNYRDGKASFSEAINCDTVVTSIVASTYGRFQYLTDYSIACQGSHLEFIIDPDFVCLMACIVLFGCS
jgi:hypothetical protein